MALLAAIGHNTLTGIGLRSLCSSITASDADACAIELFDDMQSCMESAMKFDGYVVSSDVYIVNQQYFMARKHQTVVLVEGGATTEKYNEQPLVISCHASEEQLQSAIKKIMPKSQSADMGPECALSAREREVLAAIAAGLTSKEVADKLNISFNTVLTHRKNISAKLGIRSASGLSLYALLNGII